MMRRALVATLVATVLPLAACGGGGDGGAPGTTASGSPSGRITVFAAASLTGSFEELGKRFEAANPGTDVGFSFGPSSGLAQQITQGAPADVFASASAKNMQQVVDAKAAGAPQTFAQNSMQIAVPPSNPAGIATLADLAKPGVKLALCAPEVPCGTVARTVLENAKVAVTPVTNEADVKATLTKVKLGEVDAGIVYVTDVRAAGAEVTGIEIPDDVNASTAYPIATLTEGRNAALAKAFVDYVLSTAGGEVLSAAGFDRL
jgi:molybdate transport system substrate-binding protein